MSKKNIFDTLEKTVDLEKVVANGGMRVLECHKPGGGPLEFCAQGGDYFEGYKIMGVE